MAQAALFDDPVADVARRQAALRIPLPGPRAAVASDELAAAADGDQLAAAAGVRDVRWIFDARELADFTGQPTPGSIWGWSEWSTTRPTVFVDVARCRTRGVTYGVLAHELTHLTHHGRRYSGHRPLWWTAVQQLLDRTTDL